ncbi:hypothetical protein [Pseudomonas tolaasii]|uniref:hypothetical protein n=1 Tax=Pseudomonas tolaasii TaxID=29442 RepID=UPI0009DB6C82|nr:hypothetical protein [Pseudomonas tolaasii]
MDIQTLGKNSVATMVNGYQGPYKMISPEQNAHGIILRTVYFGYPYLVVISATAPVDYLDRTKTVAFASPSRTEPFKVPAGMGVFVMVDRNYNIGINATWDVLNADGTVA